MEDAAARCIDIGICIIDQPITVLVDSATDLGTFRIDGRVRVIAVIDVVGVALGLLTGREGRARIAVSVAIPVPVVDREEFLIDDLIAVIVDPVADLHGAWIHRGIGVIAIAPLRDEAIGLVAGFESGQAIAKPIPIRIGEPFPIRWIGDAIAVVVDAVAEFLGARKDRRVRVIAIVSGADMASRNLTCAHHGVRVAVSVAVRVGVGHDVPILIDFAIAVVVEVVASLRGSRVDLRIRVVAVVRGNDTISVRIDAEPAWVDVELDLRVAPDEQEEQQGKDSVHGVPSRSLPRTRRSVVACRNRHATGRQGPPTGSHGTPGDQRARYNDSGGPMHMPFYDIGTPGTPWGRDERATWLSRQVKHRDFGTDVGRRIAALADQMEVFQYGTLEYAVGRWPLFALRSRSAGPGRPTALITGGVHGYETSGVHGALRFAEAHAADHAAAWNLVIVPCVSPWGYETINRWNPDAVDPNRSFLAESPAQEAWMLMAWLESEGIRPDLHIDLHETTDTDHTEFRPALAARDGRPLSSGAIPDGFYTVGPSVRPALGFQAAIIESVREVTHIAEPDDNGCIIGVPISSPGVILYDARLLGLCMGMTDAALATTTEVYPDSPRTSPETCIRAQVAAMEGALAFAAN